MHDADGKQTGKEYRLGAGEDPRMVAARLGAEAWRKGRGEGSGFRREITYPDAGWR
jgi:hypothetical protein